MPPPLICPIFTHNQLKHNEPPPIDDDGYVGFAEEDPDHPRSWGAAYRWTITTIVVLLATNANFASAAPSACLESLSMHFGVSELAAGLVVTLFLLGFCAGPLFLAPLSEFYGRQRIFYKTFLLYLLFTFLCAWAPNFGALLVGRFICGTMSSAALSNAPGVIADLWDVDRRGNAIGLFSALTWLGTSLGPVIGGAMELKKDWRWSFFVLLWLGGASAVLMFMIPETHADTILLRRAVAVRKANFPGFEDVKARIEDDSPGLVGIYKVALLRPWQLLFDTISLFCAIYVSVAIGLYYMLFEIYPIVFQEMRGWNAGVGQLPLLGAVAGAVLGGVMVVIDTNRLKRRAERMGVWFADMEPEERLPLAMVGGIGMAVSMYWFAWSAQYNSVHWIVPTLAGAFLSASMLLVFVAYVSYIVETYTVYAASAIAANSIARYAFSAAVPLFTQQMFGALGVGGGGSLIASVATLLAAVPFVFWKYGKRIRRRSKFTQTVDPVDRAEWRQSKDPTEYHFDREEGESSQDLTEEQGESSRDLPGVRGGSSRDLPAEEQRVGDESQFYRQGSKLGKWKKGYGGYGTIQSQNSRLG